VEKIYEVLNKLHQVQLDSLLEFKRICDKHNIKYSLVAGTLLGAVRHKGFIPWDDDVDIGMLRNEYEKFIKVAPDELKQDYFLQTWQTDPGFALPFAKLRKNGTKFVEQNSSETNAHCGVFIDIFPFDNVPLNETHKKVQNIISYILKRILLIRLNYKVWQKSEYLKKVIYTLARIFSKVFSIRQIKNRLYNVMVRYNKDVAEEIVTFGGSYGYSKESIKKEWLMDQKDIQFENEVFSAPFDSEAYLAYFYGDYMTPPPEDERYNRHNVTTIQFDEEN